MTDYRNLKPVEKRQAILDYLNAHPEGVAYAEIKTALGAGDSLSTTLNVMFLRDELGQKSRAGNVVKWIALVKQTAQTRMGPAPGKVKPNTKKPLEVEPFTGLIPYQVQPIAHTPPKVDPVYLLDKTGHSGGGQCAGRNFGSIQCNFSERSVRL